MYEKENKDYSYQIRTRQYSNINFRNEGVEEEQKNQFRARGGIPNNTHKAGFIQSSNRTDSQQWSNKYDVNGLRPKDYGRQAPYHHQESGKSSEEGGAGIYNRRQGSKKQQLQMKMNNINCINDKIYSLLNMVKKQRVYQSREDDIDDRHLRYLQQKSTSPIIKATAVKPCQKINEILEPKEDNRQQQAYLKANNKSLQRLRTLSTLEPNLNAKQAKSKQKRAYHQFQYNNQQDFENRQRNKQLCSPYKVSLFDDKSIKKENAIYGQKNEQVSAFNKNEGKFNKYSPSNSQKARSIGKVSYKTPPKYENIDSFRDYSYERASRFDEAQSSSMSKFSSNYLPVTLIKNENVGINKYEEKPQSYSGLKMIEEQIKRIKEMKGQAVSPHRNTRQRLQLVSPKRQQTPASLKGNELNRNNFELKVFPVKSDRPETIKIAEKLCFQIEIDNRMKKAKDAFFKIEGEEKWKDLSDKLTRQGIRMSVSELKNTILPPEGYFQARPDESWSKKVEIFAHQFIDAQRFWEKHVIGCANLKNLRNEGFDARKLDSSGKGCLKIEDIVNFINSYSARTYKINDISSIFRRLQLLDGGSYPEKIEFATFMKAFTM